MAITYPASYSSVQGDGGNNGLAITTDTTPTTDDVLYVGMCVNGNADTITPPGGWTEATVGDNSIASTGGQIRSWYLVDPAASTTYTWTVGTSTRRSIVAVIVRGADNDNPIDVKGSNQSAPGTNHTPPSLTSTVDNVGVVDIIGLRQFAPDTADWTPPASGLTWTEQKDVQGADSNNNIRLALATAVAGAAGALSTAVWTQTDVFEDSIDIRVAFRPAAAAATGDVAVPLGFSPGFEAPTGILTTQPLPVAQAFAVALSGSVTPSAALVRQTAKLPAGTVTPTGALVRQTNKLPAGSVTPTGALVRSTAKTLTGSVTPSGALSNLKAALRSFAGSITPSGTLTRQTNKELAGGVTPTSTLVRLTARTFAGAVAPAGAVVKRLARLLAGAVGLSGSVSNSTNVASRDLQLTLGAPETKWALGDPEAKWTSDGVGTKWTVGPPEV